MIFPVSCWCPIGVQSALRPHLTMLLCLACGSVDLQRSIPARFPLHSRCLTDRMQTHTQTHTQNMNDIRVYIYIYTYALNPSHDPLFLTRLYQLCVAMCHVPSASQTNQFHLYPSHLQAQNPCRLLLEFDSISGSNYLDSIWKGHHIQFKLQIAIEIRLLSHLHST